MLTTQQAVEAADRQALADYARVRAFASMGARNLLAFEADDPRVASVELVAASDGSVAVTLRDDKGTAVGGYAL